MKEYLIEFFEFFEYDKDDTEYLLKVYDKIAENNDANKLLLEIVSAYKENIRMDYNEELFSRTRQISKIISVHDYTVELLVFMCLTQHLKTLYKEKGINMQIFKDSLSDLKWKIEECKVVKGIRGSFVAGWFPGFFTLDRFALGRLCFEVIDNWKTFEKDGVLYEANKCKVINVHIPRTGTPIDKQSCDASYAQAREFFKDQVGENGQFICYSWMLYPENKYILSPHTNTYRFMMEYDVVDSEINNGEDLWRLFDTDEMNPNRLPTDSSMRRSYVEHLKKGGRVGCGYGVKKSI